MEIKDSEKNLEAEDKIKITKPEFILNYRVLKSSIFFTITWTIIAIISVFMIKVTKSTLVDLYGFTLAIATLYSVISAIQSLARYGGKYITIFKDQMIVHYSLLHHQRIKFNNIQSMQVENENAELILKNGKANIPLAHLNFDDQKIFLETMDRKLQK